MRKNASTKKLCSEAIVDFLVEKKISHVFDLTGGMITYLEDAISRKKGIECVPVHHEQAAGFAAEGYARKGQNFGVAIATSGPGATNLITAVGSCYFDSVPAMFIIGQVHTDNLKKNAAVRQEGFQETDIVNVVKTLTKYAVLVKDPTQVMYEIEKASYIMKRRRFGPVLIDIPINIQRTEIDLPTIKHFFGSKEHIRMMKQDATLARSVAVQKVNKLASLLSKAQAPLVVVGGGARLSGSTKELFDFVKRNNLPVVASLMGLDSYPSGDNFVGYIGSNGNREANIVFANADVIIALGTRLDVRQIGSPKFFNPGVKLVHIDIDSSSIDYMITSTISFEMDLQTFFQATKGLKTDKKKKWSEFINAVAENFSRPLEFDTEHLNPNTFINELSSVAPSNSTIVADVGQNQMWCAQSWKTKKGQRLLFSGGMGAMGFALPVAIGAWYASPSSVLIVTCGDGGLQINIQEMETVRRNNIPLKMFIFNNKSLGMVREFQDLYFNKNYQSSVTGYGVPDLKKIADAYGFEYVRITSISKGDTQIAKVMESNQPVLIEVDLHVATPLHPKVVYGHTLDDQSPYLNNEQKELLESLKKHLRES